MRVFLDANIMFSAAKSDGAVRALLAFLRGAGHELWADGYVAEEARRNIRLKSPQSMARLEELLGASTLVPIVSGAAIRAAAQLPEKDRPVLEAAIRHGCDVLITGDRTHFGRLYGKVVDGVEVLSPAGAAERLLP